MLNYFVFSSPFQYMMTLLVSRRFPEDNNIGYYYYFHEDMRDYFKQIEETLGFKIPIYDINNTSLSTPDRLFISNRYNHDLEIKLFLDIKDKCSEINFIEEGLIYKSIYGNRNISDHNIKLFLKNKLKSLFHSKQPSHIYLSEFSYIYSVFDEIPISVDIGKQIIIGNDLKKLSELRIDSSLNELENSCLFLSEWLTREEFITEKQYLAYLENTIRFLKTRDDNILYKPHPRDLGSLTETVLKFYDVQLLPAPYDKLPAEFLISRPGLDVYGFGTIAMFYSKPIFGNQSYSLMKDIASQYGNKKMIELLNFYYDANVFDKYDVKEIYLSL